jgi:hypothetical protein
LKDWDWDNILSSLIQLAAAILIFAAATRETKAKKKGTKRSRPGKRK